MRRGAEASSVIPATRTPEEADPVERGPMAACSWAPKPPACSSTTCLRRYGPPSAPRVVWALARFSAATSMRRRSAVRAEPETSRASNMPISLHPEGDLDDVRARAGDGDRGLVLERVGGQTGRLGVDVDRRAVRAKHAGGGVGGDGEAGVLELLAVTHGRGQGAVEVDVHPAVAGSVRVGEVGGERRLAQRGALDGAFQREL